jgi:hypothetical protein
MELFLILVLVGFVYFMIQKSKKNNQPTYNNVSSEDDINNKSNSDYKVTVTSNYDSETKFIYPKIKLINNEWVLNPNANFQLTLQKCEKEAANEIRSILDNEEIYGRDKIDKLLEIFSVHNVLVKEVEEYKTKYQKQYFDKIEELKNNSTEWKNAYEADKNDLLEEFRETALNTIYERPNVDLKTLFENEPNDRTIDDQLIKDFGFENIQTYLRYSDKPEKIRIFPNDHYARPKFENLEKINLAERGYKLPKEDILLTLTLKQLNSISKHPEKQFSRKQQAVDYILTLPNLEENIGKNVSMREMFRLKKLPEKYNHIILTEISNAWNYTTIIVELLISTYRNTFYFDSNKKEDKDYIKGYKIEYRREDIHCECCKNHSEKTYTESNIPSFPLHIGCQCFIDTIYDFD